MSSFGDVILTTPVITALKEKLPDATIDFLVFDQFSDAIAGNHCIDRLITFDKNKYNGLRGILRFTKQIKAARYDLIIDLHAKLRSILLSYLSGVRVLRYKKRVWWKSIGVRLRLIRYHVDDSIIRNYFRPLARLGISYAGELLTFDFSAEDARKVKDFENCIVMSPGAANNTKKWPKAYFARLGVMLEGDIVLIGGAADQADLEEIQRTIGPRCRNMAGKLSFKESGALIARCKYIITNDSGPFHVARALGKRAFVFFGPTDPNMFEYNQNAIVIRLGIDCSPCSLHGDRQCPRGHFSCMKDLTPGKVHEIIKKSGV